MINPRKIVPIVGANQGRVNVSHDLRFIFIENKTSDLIGSLVCKPTQLS